VSRFLGVLALMICTLLAAAPAFCASDLDGNWNMTFNSDDGDRQVPATFKVENGQVTGRFAEKGDVKGTYSEGKLELKFPFVYEEGGLEGDLKLTGKVAEGKITGNWEYAGYAGTFSAAKAQ
jgi:hypothetical protein